MFLPNEFELKQHAQEMHSARLAEATAQRHAQHNHISRTNPILNLFSRLRWRPIRSATHAPEPQIAL